VNPPEKTGPANAYGSPGTDTADPFHHHLNLVELSHGARSTVDDSNDCEISNDRLPYLIEVFDDWQPARFPWTLQVGHVDVVHVVTVMANLPRSGGKALYAQNGVSRLYGEW
jgi:hypothetical protein